MSFRQTVIEKDLSSFVTGVSNETGGFVIKAKKGPNFPVLITSTDDFIRWFGTPNQDFWGGYEVLNFINTAPAWVARVVGSGYKHAGVDVTLTSVIPFGADTGRVLDTYSLSALPTQYVANLKKIAASPNDTYDNPLSTLVQSDGLNTTYTGNIFTSLTGQSPVFEPNTSGLRIKVYNNQGAFVREVGNIAVSAGPSNSRTITGTGLDGSNSTINVTSGAMSLDFTGTVGTPFIYRSGRTYTTDTATITLPTGREWAIYLTIDNNVIDEGNLVIVDDGTLTVAEVITQINARINASIIKKNNLVTYDPDSDRIVITGTKGDSQVGKFRMKAPLNSEKYFNPIPYIFETQEVYDASITTDGITETVNATNPSGYILKNGEYIEVSYIVSKDMDEEITHSFFATSPYEDKDFDYRIAVQYTPDSSIENGNRVYTLNLYETIDGKLELVSQYVYSLDRVKDRSGASLYILDVFRNNPYLLPVINETLTTISEVNRNAILSPLLSVRLTGGKRGNNPTETDMLKGWNFYKKAKRYPIKIFMNTYGDTTSFNAIKDILSNYQKYSFGISIVPYNFTPQDAIDYRRGLNIDSDRMALYHNWQQIVDVFNGNARIWVSGIGKIGKAYANMENIFDAESPAGVNENGIGGQLDTTGAYTAIDVQYDYDEFLLKSLDDAQINPIVLDPLYGLIVKGDRTLRVVKGDTAYIGARRLYNYILSNIIDQVLTLQEFRLNDALHRARMAEFCGQIIQPILNAGYLREAQIICDDTNNNDEVLNRREFVIDIYVKVTPNSQFIKLNFIRLSQTQSIGSIG